MNKIFSSYLIVGVVALFLLLTPKGIFAAELTFKVIPNTGSIDDTTLVEVRIDPESKRLNVIEGTISFQGEVADDLLVQIENGQSILPLWPVPPQYIESEKAIHFTGGIPDGFNKEGLLFRLKLSSITSGNLDISYINGNAYLNDGKGTKDSVSSNSLSIHLDKIGNDQVTGIYSRYKQFKNGIIILLVIVGAFIVFRYGYKKYVKK